MRRELKVNNMQPTAEFGPVRFYAGSRNGRFPEGNQVIVQGADSRAVFDSPLVSHRIGGDFDGADLAIQGHIHEDHTTGLVRLRDVPVYVHEADLPAIQSWEGLRDAYGYEEATMRVQIQYMEEGFHFVLRPDAIGYKDQACWELGGGVKVQAIHMPGHTAGHCVLLVEPVGLAFIGDIELSGFGPYYGDKSSSLTQTRSTLKRLRSVPARVWVTSHDRGFYTDKEAMLADLRAYEEKMVVREERIVHLLKERPRTLEELVNCRVLWPVHFEAHWVEDSERFTISRHLQELLERGRVNKSGDGFFSLA